MPNLFPYTNTHELNLDWILQVVKDFQTKYTTFDQALADALAAIQAGKTEALDEISTDLTAALNDIEASQTAALTAIGNTKDSALADIGTALTNATNAISALNTTVQAEITTLKNTSISQITTAQGTALSAITASMNHATTIIEQLYNTLPASAQDILGRLDLLDNIITGNTMESFTWLQGSYIYPEGQTPPTPPAIWTESPTYNQAVSSRYMTGVGGRRIRIITDGTIHITLIPVWRNTPPGGGPSAYVPGQSPTFTNTYADILLPLDVTAFSIELAKPNSADNIAPTDIPGHIEIQWITDFVSQRIIAPKESSTTADAAREEGEYFFLDGDLYIATDDIAVGDTITEGTNCEKKTVGGELSDLKSAVKNIAEGDPIKYDREVTWQAGYVNQDGLVKSSSLSGYALVPVRKGEKITIGTANSNITILGSTTENSVSVGDTITPILTTTPSGDFETFNYTAPDEMTLVLCVRMNNYTLEFYAPAIQGIISQSFDDATPYQPKSYVMQNGDLFSLPVGHEVNVTWENTNKKQTTVMDEVGKVEITLSSMNNNLLINADDWSFNSWTSLTDYDNNNANSNTGKRRIRYKGELSSPVDSISINPNGLGFEIALFDENKTVLYYKTDFVYDKQTFNYAGIKYIKIDARNASNVNITYDEIQSMRVYQGVDFTGDGVSAEFDKLRCNDVYIYDQNARHVPNSNRPALTLLHFSDLHADKAALHRIVKEATNIGQIDDIICSGDMVVDTAEQIQSWWNERVLTCIGNHDTATYQNGSYTWDALSMADRDAYYIAPFESNWDIVHTSGKSYYYKDYADQKIRMIVMDCMLYYNPGAEATAQTAWLDGLLADTLDSNDPAYGYHVLIVIHAPHGGAESIDCSFSRYGAYTAPSDSSGNTPQSVIDTVASKISSGLIFIGYLVGHTHIDYMFDAESDHTQLMYCVTCASVDTPQWKNSDQYRGVDADAYNVVTIDTAHTLVKIVRGGGANVDDHMRTRKAICFNYSTGTKVGEVL